MPRAHPQRGEVAPQLRLPEFLLKNAALQVLS